MASTRIGYIGVDHHHRDPYFQVANRLPVDIVALCEPGKTYSPSDITPLTDRPDEITSEGVDIGQIADQAHLFEDPETMLAETDLDAVWVTYRNDTVPAIIDSAVDHGVDVLSEKPVAKTTADLLPVAKRATEAEVTIGATYFYRYNPVAKALKQYVSEGLFGDIWSVDGRYIGSKLTYRDTSHYIYDDEISRGGALQWIGLHWIDLFNYILDDPIARVCASENTHQDSGIDEGMALQFETATGTTGTFQTGYYLDAPIKDTRFAVYGRGGNADSPLHHNARSGGGAVPLDLQSEHPEWDGAPNRRVEYELGYDRFPAWGDYVLDFFGDFFSGRDTGSVPADVGDALRVLAVLDAAYESVESNKWVSVTTPHL